MTRMIILFAVLALVPAAFAQAPGTGGLEVVPTRSNPSVPSPTPDNSVPDAQSVAKLLSSVSDVNAMQIVGLLERIGSVTSGKDGSMATMFAIQAELTRQTRAFKAAHSAALSGKDQDVDELFAQVIDGKPAPDAAHIAQVAATYESLLTQFGQLVNSRFLASSAGGIPTYHAEQHVADAATVAEAARTRSAAYEANVNRAASDLKGLLALR